MESNSIHGGPPAIPHLCTVATQRAQHLHGERPNCLVFHGSYEPIGEIWITWMLNLDAQLGYSIGESIEYNILMHINALCFALWTFGISLSFCHRYPQWMPSPGGWHRFPLQSIRHHMFVRWLPSVTQHTGQTPAAWAVGHTNSPHFCFASSNGWQEIRCKINP